MEIFFTSDIIRAIAVFGTAFLIAFYSIPVIVSVAVSKNFFAIKNGRNSHVHATPTLGGVAIFSGLMISSLIFLNFQSFLGLQYIFAGLTIIFFIGIKDDILSLSPLKKLVGQIAASLLVIDLGNIRFTTLHGFAGIYEINYFTSLYISLFVFIVIINAFNLIDGIDGLAAGIGFVCAMTFGTWFLIAGFPEIAIMAYSVSGALIAFFIFNVFGNKNKIFMGDTGSLLLGFLSAILVVVFNEKNAVLNVHAAVYAAPAVSIGILAIPLFDTFRIFTIRITKMQSPFRADRNHIHHRLLDLGLSHFQSTLILQFVNLLIIAMVFILQFFIRDILILVMITFALCIGLSQVPVLLLKARSIKELHNTISS